MVDKNNSKSEYEKFIVSNAAFSFLTSTCCVEYLHAFIKNYNMCLKENGEKIDDQKIDIGFINIRENCCCELENLKNMKLALFKFMHPDDMKHYDDFMDEIEKKLDVKKEVEQV